MEAYGFDNVLSMGNQHNEAITNLNRQIRMSNVAMVKQHQEDITQAKNSIEASATPEKETETIAETIGGQVASKGKDIQVVGKVVKSLPQVAELTLNKTEDLLYPSDTAIRGARGEVSGTELLNSAKSFLTDNVSKGVTLGEKASSIGKLGIASTGLSIGMGLADTVEDLSAGKIEGDNTAERVSNVAGIASGGLEAVGTALDLTGIGAPVGVALNLLGGLAGAVSGVSGVVGEAQSAGKQQADLEALQKKAVPQQQTASFEDTSSSGAVVKSN